jgi:hypothetical protein
MQEFPTVMPVDNTLLSLFLNFFPFNYHPNSAPRKQQYLLEPKQLLKK